MAKVIRLEANWTNDQPAPVSTRELAIDNLYQALLIDGGRWLLFSKRDTSGRTSVCDMDSATGKETNLVQPMDPDETTDVYRFVISVCDNTPRLSFNLAIATESIENWRPGTLRMSVWHVALGTNSETLLAEHITSFNTGHDAFGDVQIQGNILGYASKNADGPGYAVHMYRWTKCDLSVQHVATIRLNGKRSPDLYLRFLPNQRILVVYRSGAAVYDISELTFVPATSNCDIESPPSWAMDFSEPWGPEYINASTTPPECSSFLITNGTVIYRVVMPQNGPADFQVFDTIKFVWPSVANLGSRRGLSWEAGGGSSYIELSCLTIPDQEVAVVNLHNSPQYRSGRGEMPLVRTCRLERRTRLPSTCVNERSGRVFMYSKGFCFVVDFA
ncbi:hypothetical protein FRB94_011332 [Tulasnella sp. JGI-2019a]|nr:hypothetical protein FRB94_011332 [Tulasnella sp. JGI-2019a]